MEEGEEYGRNVDTQTTPGSGQDSDDTPRTEMSAASMANTPAYAYDGDKGPDEGYFGLQLGQGQPSSSISSLQVTTSPTLNSSAHDRRLVNDAHSLDITRRLTHHLDASDKPAAQREFSYTSADRPAVQRDSSHISTASMESTDSTITVTGQDSGYTYAMQHRPSYPNQAFSALQQQRYPPPHLPPTLRTKTYHPAQPQTFRQAIASLHQSGSKTADPSPETSPGLFNPTSSPPVRSNLGPDEQGFYASPFLHFTHRQAPKETHVADVDIDPISGRKLVNNYEIIDELGRGTHGKVKLGRNLETHEYVAIKIVERYSKRRRLGKLGNAEDKVKKEVAILKKARHPNIVALLEVIDDPARKKVYIVLERVEFGEIVWRAPAPKEIALIECRRYDRESHGILEDPDAEAEDRAILEEARIRRIKQQRRVMRKIRRERLTSGPGPEAWSFEFGGDTDDEESDMERASRVSTVTTAANSTESLSRAPTPAPRAESEAADLSTPVRTTAPALEATEPPAASPLEGTMYGAYEDDETLLRAPSLTSSVQSFGAHHITHSHSTLAAADLLDSDIHPELLHVPCMALQAARIAFRDTVLGLQYLHWQGIIHRDIKPPNLLQTHEHRTKISDFGVSYLGRPINEDQAENLSESDAQDFDEAKELAKTVGTAAFYAPELCYTDMPLDGETIPSVGKAIDVWALGITLYCMLFGRTPFVDSEYVVMRRIADEEIYIPRKRLRPVDPRPKSRPSSHGRHFQSAASGKRSEFELAYEDLDDTLLDLLSRLLIKDPEKRINLEEVRHHPWVLADIPNKELWLDETDPSRQAQGKKIQVSNEELQDAVVPVKLVERIRSGLKKTVGGLMSGLGRASSTRQRTPSMSGSHPSANSSSSTISQDVQHSLRGDEAIFSALKASRDNEHPLAQSVTASPVTSPTEVVTSASTPNGAPGRRDYLSQSNRPNLPERGVSLMSTSASSASARTIRPGDAFSPPVLESAPPSPSLPSMNETSTVSNLGGLLTGAGRRILRSVRDRSTAGRSTDSLERSASRGPPDSIDSHGGPSVAVTNTQASGHFNPPEALRDLTPASSAGPSPVTSRPQSVVVTDRRDPTRERRTVARQESSASLAARHRFVDSDDHDQLLKSPRRIANDSTEEGFRRAEDEYLRRRILEDRERASAASDRIVRPMSPNTCPPSPDDDLDTRAKFRVLRSDPASSVPSMETSPTSRTSSALPLMTPISSEDRFPGGTPMTLSNPSIPSVTTVDSDALNEEHKAQVAKGEPLSAVDSKKLNPFFGLEDDGYTGELAVDSEEEEDDYDDSSDDDGGLQMVSRRSGTQGARHSFGSHSNRRETGSSVFSKKSSRSGSSNTMKKIRSNEESCKDEDDEQDGSLCMAGP